MAFKLYTDAACTQVFSGVLSTVHYSDHSEGSLDYVFYFADVERDPADNGAYKLVMLGGGNVNLSIVDSTPGSGHEATEIKTALTAGGLDGAAAGAPLSLGVAPLSGVSNAIPIHVRVTNAVTSAGVSVELRLRKPEAVALAA
ncbi:hypothetical protein [Marinobacterium lutimaris]|uniref:Uncharacterized protein n=1 Tax=Marinobacterium lutimaris TaxID=568106 RepID=A0A1H5Y9S9_9GAMM|nr:hypothetical protein [Marinobacterium lutimaris]SEG20216.1 hypothetical protein SAMN05444390_1011657 [Marinobacterium lutimaris]